MTVQIATNGSIVLSGDCPNEDAEPLLQALLALPSAVVDWRLCDSAHTAVFQVLIASRRPVLGPPAGSALRAWAQPLLRPATIVDRDKSQGTT